MNYYILLEDEKSFIKVLPTWLEHMGFMCTRVADIQEVRENNYVLQSGQGVTQLITKVLFDTIDTILDNPGKIDELIVILDTEELNCESRKNQVVAKINERCHMDELPFHIKILVCNHCFETWLLGKMGLYPMESVPETSFFYPYYKHYNISEKDPENMKVPLGMAESVGKYHFHYLHELFRYKRIRYSKKKPDYVMSKVYFDGIVRRMTKKNQIKSFQEFYEYFKVEA